MPLLEYACELCDGCCSRDSDKLEQLQFEAARIITGLPHFASKESLDPNFKSIQTTSKLKQTLRANLFKVSNY